MSMPTEEITLREITRESLFPILRLEPEASQKQFVASNAISIAQGHFHPEAWFRGIYADEEPVGFLMLEDWTQRPREAPDRFNEQPYLGVWRFMIDQHHQRKGYGAAAMEHLITETRVRDMFHEILLSYVPRPGNPHDFYAKFGFKETGEIDGEEVVMSLSLK